MDFSLFARGLLIGLSIAAVVGPMSVLCMQRTISHGFAFGLISGLGIATADAIYGSIAAFGVTAIATLLVSVQSWVRLIGGGFLVYLGITSLLKPPAQQAAAAPRTATSYGSAYLATLGLTLTNPLTILSFAAIFAGLGVVGGSGGSIGAALLVAGVFSGSALWWCILTGGISLLRTRLTARWLRWINRLSGAVIALFGLVAIISVLHPYHSIWAIAYDRASSPSAGEQSFQWAILRSARVILCAEGESDERYATLRCSLRSLRRGGAGFPQGSRGGGFPWRDGMQ
jgi:threonine/homoserine/homoserine lactone efflux protein